MWSICCLKIEFDKWIDKLNGLLFFKTYEIFFENISKVLLNINIFSYPIVSEAFENETLKIPSFIWDSGISFVNVLSLFIVTLILKAWP